MYAMRCAKCDSMVTRRNTNEHNPVMTVCARCGSDDLEQVWQCNQCGEWIPAETNDCAGFCPQCTAEVIQQLKIDISKYTDAEREVIYETLTHEGIEVIEY